MKSKYDNLIPKGVLFNLREVETMKILKINMAKKMILNGDIEFVKIGSKVHLARDILIQYLEDNTITQD